MTDQERRALLNHMVKRHIQSHGESWKFVNTPFFEMWEAMTFEDRSDAISQVWEVVSGWQSVDSNRKLRAIFHWSN